MSEPVELPTRNDDADAKAWFYLDHRHDIESWAALRADAARLVEQYLRALVPTLSDLADEHGARVYERDLESGAWPRFGLFRDSWSHDGQHDVAVVAEWERSRLLSGTRTWPYVGVRITPRQKDAERRQAVAAAVAPARRAFTDARTSTWPAWQYVVPASSGAGVDPGELAADVWRRLNELWQLTALALDALHDANPEQA